MNYKLTTRLNNHLTRNSAKYAAGTTMDYKAFRRTLKRFIPALDGADPTTIKGFRAYNNAQTKMNKLLERRGLYLTSSKGYTQFAILDMTQVPKKVKHFKNKAKWSNQHAKTLNNGYLTHKCTWSKLDQAELREIAPHMDRMMVGVSYR